MNTLLLQLREAEKRRAEKIKSLVALLEDPEIADVVVKLKLATAQPVSNGNGHQSKLPAGTKAAILAIARKLPPLFTSQDIVDQLITHGFVFTRKKPADMVRDAVYAFVHPKTGSPTIRLVEPGTGGKMNKYEFTDENLETLQEGMEDSSYS